jgi:L-ascorbate metabolism protein UlaG (beta-lactamase superfamily)
LALLPGLRSVGADAPPPVDTIATAEGDLAVHPINHATLALQWNKRTVVVDPVGGAARFNKLGKADLVLVTDIHGDHFDPSTLQAVLGEKAALIVPPAVAEKLPADLKARASVLAHGQNKEMLGFKIETVPAYNTTPERTKFHAKDRGVGYLLTLGGKRVYISGDTEDIPEMRALKNVDLAFLCMNLPYTMTVEQAADAVRAFRPKVVYPYHYRGSDLEKFKTLVGTNAGVEVRLRDWYAR